MVAKVKAATARWQYDVVSIGLPAPVINDRLLHEPVNLGGGWVPFDFAAAFGKPVKLINDAAMQALGSYHGGRMLFLGLGTGLDRRRSSTASSSRWSWPTCPTGRRRTMPKASQSWLGKAVG